MAKFIHDTVMDVLLQYIADSADAQALCKDQPADVAGVGTHGLGTAPVLTAEWTLGAGDTSGRKMTSDGTVIAIGTSGTVSHIAFYNSATLFAVATIAPTSVTASGTVTVNAFDLNEVRDPA